MTAAVLNFRRERAIRAFRERPLSAPDATRLASQLESTPSALERFVLMASAGYTPLEARAVLQRLGYIEHAEKGTRCASCRRKLSPRAQAVFEPSTGRAWCNEGCLARSRHIASSGAGQ